MNNNSHQNTPSLLTTATTIKLLGSGLLLLSVTKVYLAIRLDLYSDEIFYWLASTKPAPAYSDLPFVTSLLVWLGSKLDPGNTLAVRSLFILLGSSVPLLVYWLALPITDKQQALQSALLALCIPLGGFLGLLAVPDVPLLFFGILAIGFFERALRTDQFKFWIATGLVVALGLCTHYRFFLYPVAAIVFLLLYKKEWKQWRNLRFWLAIVFASMGLIPIVWFNLTNQLASASFYLVERHPWSFQSSGLLHIFKQAGLVTPPLYGLLILTLWSMVQRARQGHRAAALLASFALLNLLVYLLLAPWTDASSTSIHWPLSGYFPVLVFAPAVLSSCYQWIAERWSEALARKLLPGVPVLGFLGSIVALVSIGSQAFQQPVQSILGTGVLSNKMAGWREFATHTSRLLNTGIHGQEPVLVTDNYYTAAQVKFAGLSDQVYTVDSDKAFRDGRYLQMQLWGMDTSALSKAVSQPVLFITEDSTLSIPDKEVAIGTICQHVDQMNYLDTLVLFEGDKQFSYYFADSIVDGLDQSAFAADRCPFPARGWIDQPGDGTLLTGIVQIQGWAYNEDMGIQSVRLFIDDDEVALMDYGLPRPDVVRVMSIQSDPNAPDLGFQGELDTRTLSNGEHELFIRMVNSRGVISHYGHRQIHISN